MNNKSTFRFTLMQIICCIPLVSVILFEMPLPLQVLLPFFTFVSVAVLVRFQLSHIAASRLDSFRKALEAAGNDPQELRKIILQTHEDYQLKPSCHNHDRLLLLRSYLLTRNLSESDILTTDATVSREIRRLFMAHGKVKQFISEYVTTALEPFFQEEQIRTIARHITRYYDNENCQVEIHGRIPYPSDLPLQDFSHFAHNLAELIGYFKKYKQINLFKFLLRIIDLKIVNIHAMYRNSTRTTSSTRIPLYRIQDDGNPLSDFIRSLQQ